MLQASSASCGQNSRLARALAVAIVCAASVVGVVSCGSTTTATPQLDDEALRDPETCRSCHEGHVRAWEGSMHAYAADDPVFLAMNRRMRRERPELPPDTCTRCHAPMAVRRGLLTGGEDVSTLARRDKGVTCIFCHTLDAVEGSHGAQVRTANDGVMRGGIRDPRGTVPHGAAYSKLHDRESAEASAACGACHDVVTPSGLHLERTFAEWQGSVYAKPGPAQLGCGKCHMEGTLGKAASTNDVPERRVHDHAMPGIDLALTPFPHAEEQRRRVEAALSATLLSRLCVRPSPSGVAVDVTLDNAFSGHDFPSGATHDRRVWVELHAKDGTKELLVSGHVPQGTSVFEAKRTDPRMLVLGSGLAEGRGRPVTFLWDAETKAGVTLPPAVTNDPSDPRYVHSLTHTYEVPGLPSEVSFRVFVRAIDVDTLNELVRSGDLAADVASRVPTLEVTSAAKRWTSDLGLGCVGK